MTGHGRTDQVGHQSRTTLWETLAPAAPPGSGIHVGKYRRFLPVAVAFASLSKYPRTKVGAVVLGPGYEVRSSGWNGAPRGSDADVDHRLQDRDEALHWIAHAESNAIVNAARCGTPLDGCVIVVTHPPCMSCAKLIVQAGIKAVLCPPPTPEFAERWSADMGRASLLFAECGVENITI